MDRDGVRQIPGNHARFAIAIRTAAMLDGDALNAPGKVGRPRDSIWFGRVYAKDDGHLLRGEILVPPELLQHAEGELGIPVLDLEAHRIGAVRKQVFVHLLLDLLTVHHDLAFDDALDAEARAKSGAAVRDGQIGVVENGRAGMPKRRRSPARPWQTVVVTADLRIILRRSHGDQVEFVLISHMRFETL